MEIEFKLAEFDPEGNLTTGITRKETSVERWDIGSDMKYDDNDGKDPWLSRDYLNIWIVSRLTENGVAGFAQPGGSFPGNARIDGVVLLHNYTGTIGTASASDLGRTGTHEVGHWLSLHHVWGGFNQGEEEPSCLMEDDEVADTPFTFDANFGCNFNRNQCSDENPDFPDMVENYMDYASSSCQGLFTHGQKDRSLAVLNTTRSQITTSSGIRERGEKDVMLVSVLNPANGEKSCSNFTPMIEVVNFGSGNLLYFEIDYSIGGQDYSHQWVASDGGIAPWNSLSDLPKKITVELPEVELSGEETNYTFEVTLKNPNGDDDFFVEDNTVSFEIETVNAGIEPLFTESFDFIVFPPIGWSIFNGDNSQHWRFKSSKDALLEVGVGDTECAMMDNFAYEEVGEVDELIMRPMDFTGDLGKISLHFYHAYALMDESSTSDVLSVMISSDCGNTFVPIAHLFAEELVTADPSSGPFIPNEGDWQKNSISLSDYINTNNHIIIKFSQTRGSGNNLFIDEVEIRSETTDIDAVISSTAEVRLYPNPTNSSIQLEFEAVETADLQLELIDKMGRQVYTETINTQNGLNQHRIGLEELPSGVYFVKIQDGNQVHTKKLMVF